jgi:hypothetical protein
VWLQIASNIERQSDFIRYLITEVDAEELAVIKDMVTFIKWLDDELSLN